MQGKKFPHNTTVAFTIAISSLLALVALLPAGTIVLAASIVCTGFPCTGTEQDDTIDATNLDFPSFDIEGLGGDDVILGSNSGHHLLGGEGDDTLNGGDIGDVLSGGEGDDELSGDGGDDFLGGEQGDDTLSGEEGNDFLEGGIGDDKLAGGQDDDNLFGGQGNDKVQGDSGDDFLSGLEGNDDLSGGEGDDILFGYDGADKFRCGSGQDTVVDFNEDQGDKKSSDCENIMQNTATIIVLKEGNLGPQDPGDFQAEVIGGNPFELSTFGLPVPGEKLLAVALEPGSYVVHEIGESGGRLTDRDFDVEYSDDCSGTISSGETVICTITNTFTGES